MKRSREALKAELMAQFEAKLDELLDWGEGHPEPTLVQIEEAVLRCRQETGRALVSGLVGAQEKEQPVPGPRCPVCGEEMRFKGRKRKQLQTLVGDVEVERGYYHCPRCRRGFSPPR